MTTGRCALSQNLWELLAQKARSLADCDAALQEGATDLNSAIPKAPQGRTLYNQQRNASRDIERARSDRNLYNKYSDRDQYGHKGDHDHDMNFRHRGVVSGNFHEHGRHFHYRRFWNGAWVFLNDWDDCTAWMWVHVAPGPVGVAPRGRLHWLSATSGHVVRCPLVRVSTSSQNGQLSSKRTQPRRPAGAFPRSNRARSL